MQRADPIRAGAIFVVATAVIAFLAPAPPNRSARADETRPGAVGRQDLPPFSVDLLQLSRENPLPVGKGASSTELARGAESSLHLVQLRTTVPLHRHTAHEEVVSVLAGTARMRLGERELNVGPGSVLLIPRGTAHAVVNDDTTKVLIALSCFTPPFDGTDRHYLDEP